MNNHYGTILDNIKHLGLIYLYFPPSFHLTVVVRPFVVNKTFSTGLVGVEVTSVSWPGQLEFKSLIIVSL